MLFLPESVYQSRRALLKDLDRGKLTAEQAYQRMLEMEATDHIALVELGRLRQQVGDRAGAEECFWRAVQAQPWHWGPYLGLAQLLADSSEQAPLSQGLAELAFRKLLLDDEALENLSHEPPLRGFEGIEGLKDLSRAEQIELAAEALRRRRDLEPAAVTARLRPHRLIHQLQEAADIDAQFVDVLVQEGQAIVPLLVGVLRAWAQNYLTDDDECTVENVLALLGEIGDAAAIPCLLEFAALDNVDLSGAASWALDRIIESHSDQAAPVIGDIAPGLAVPERIAVVEKLLRHRRLDASGELFMRLSENLSVCSNEDRERFVPLLLMAIITARGRPGLELARATLRRTSDLLSRKGRALCEDLIADLGAGSIPVPPSPEPSPWTVYDICAGNAVWEDDEEESGDEEDDFSPEPARRKHTPGRNDPCWCGSGRKYKKCHLEADQQAGNGGAPAARGDFDGLRRRLGDFLAQVVPRSDSRLAMEEFFGDDQPEEQETASLIDWMMHDWISPRLGRTVMQEYLRRHGSSLPAREHALVEAWSRSFVGLYEVQEVRVGSGIEVKDLVSDKVFFVHDVSLSKQLVRWDGLLARVVEGERGLEFTGVGVTVPRQQLEPLREWMEEDRRRVGLPWPDYLKRNLPRIRRQPSQLSAEWFESLQLCNTDGEELLFSKAVYSVLDEEALISALNGWPELSKDEEGERHNWLKGPPGEDGRTVLGSFRIERGEFVFECNSKARLERGKAELAARAGAALRHLRDEFTTQNEMKRRVREKPPAAESTKDEIPAEVRHALITEALEQHFAKWPDTALPALDGETPRQAAKTAAGRRKLSALLRDFENAEEHKRRAGEPHYDVSRLRAQLGLKE